MSARLLIFRSRLRFAIHGARNPVDPGDEMVLEAAIIGGADWLVSFNRKHFGNLPERFGIELLSPAEALWRMRT